MRIMKRSIFFSGLLLADMAMAYGGPGVSAGLIAVVLGILGAIFLAFLSIVWYPIKRLFKPRKVATEESKPARQATYELDTDRINDRDGGRASDSLAPDDNLRRD